MSDTSVPNKSGGSRLVSSQALVALSLPPRTAAANLTPRLIPMKSSVTLHPNMKKLLRIFTLAAAAALAPTLVGCAGFHTVNDNVPHTTIKGKVAGQPFELQNPKDTVLEGLEVTAGTNGAMIKIAKLTTVMNPANTLATGEAGDKLVKATGDSVVNGVNAGASIAAKAFAAWAGNPAAALQTPGTNAAQ